MMAGSYSIPMAGGGLPQPLIGSIDIDWGMMENNAMTSIFIENGEVIGGHILPFKQAEDKHLLAVTGGCPEGMDCAYRGGKMIVYDPVSGEKVDEVDLNTLAFTVAISGWPRQQSKSQ